MKKIYEFVSKYGVYVLLVLAIVLLFGCCVIPFFIYMGRSMWDAALNNPTAFM